MHGPVNFKFALHCYTHRGIPFIFSCFVGHWHICGRILLPHSCWQHRYGITQSPKFWRIFRWKLRNSDL